MPIRHMQEFAALRRQGDTTIARRRALLEVHQQMVQKHIEELQQNQQAITQKIETYHWCPFTHGVLRLDMVDKSTGPRQTHFGRVFGDEAVQTGLLSPE